MIWLKMRHVFFVREVTDGADLCGGQQGLVGDEETVLSGWQSSGTGCTSPKQGRGGVQTGGGWRGGPAAVQGGLSTRSAFCRSTVPIPGLAPAVHSRVTALGACGKGKTTAGERKPKQGGSHFTWGTERSGLGVAHWYLAPPGLHSCWGLVFQALPDPRPILVGNPIPSPL